MSRPHWSSISLTTETTRVLPILLPVGFAAIAGLVIALVALATDPPHWTVAVGTAALLAAATAAEAFPLPIEGVTVGTTSLAIVFIVATGVIYGWREATVVGFLSMALVEIARRRRWSRIVFNTGLYVSAAIASGVAAHDVGKATLAARVVSGFVGSAAFYTVNMILLAAVVARARGVPFSTSFRRYVASTFLPFLVMASLAATLVVLWDLSPFVSFVIVGPLVTIALYERWLHGALDRLREFDRLKDEFIAVIAHELRTPLTSVYGAALTLQKQNVRDEMRETLLAIVSDEAGRLARLLDDALSASRLHAQTEKFDIAPTDGAEVARSVVETERSRLPEGLELALARPTRVPLVQADPDRLRQVLMNLMENAIKYSPDGGRIELRIEPHDSIVRFSVSDEGIGIPLDAQAYIFERFHRADPNMTRGVGGTGLGLYIAREIIEHMDGRIWVNSREGEGSTFAFDLPVAELAA
jgi:signal transduction histidine kinase